MKTLKPQTRIIDVKTRLEVDYPTAVKRRSPETGRKMTQTWVKKIMAKSDEEIINRLRGLLSCRSGRISDDSLQAYNTRIDSIIDKIKEKQNV